MVLLLDVSLVVDMVHVEDDVCNYSVYNVGGLQEIMGFVLKRHRKSKLLPHSSRERMEHVNTVSPQTGIGNQE